MARVTGLSSFAANFEPKVAGPIDSRCVVQYLSDLTLLATWNRGDGNAYVYVGLPVSVTEDANPDNNGLYLLKAADYTNIANWEKIGSGGSGGSTIPFNWTFLTSSWITVGPLSTITIPPSTHSQGESKYLYVGLFESGTPNESLITSYKIGDTGTVTIETVTPFDGFVIISNLNNSSPFVTSTIHNDLIDRDAAGNHSVMRPLADSADSFKVTKADGVSEIIRCGSLTDLVNINSDLEVKHPLSAQPYMKFIRGGVKAITDGVANPDVGFILGTMLNLLSYSPDFAQINIQNLNDGLNSSSDIVCTAGDGTNSEKYINVGINSSEFPYNAISPLGTGERTGYLMADQEIHIYNTVIKPILFGINSIVKARLDQNQFRVYADVRLDDISYMGTDPECLTTKQYVDSLMHAGRQTLTASGSSTTINLSLGRFISLNLSSVSNPHSINLTNAVVGIEYYIYLIQGASAVNVNFPVGTKQAGGGGAAVIGVSNAEQMVACLFDNTNYYISTQRYF